MNDNTFTPGPWAEFAESGEWWIQRCDDDRNPVGDEVICWSNRTKEADVALICAAPDLYAACQLALNAFERRDAIDWGILETALNKARGTA